MSDLAELIERLEKAERKCPYASGPAGICLAPRCVCAERRLREKHSPPWNTAWETDALRAREADDG